jgi:hypothetical protein
MLVSHAEHDPESARPVAAVGVYPGRDRRVAAHGSGATAKMGRAGGRGDCPACSGGLLLPFVARSSAHREGHHCPRRFHQPNGRPGFRRHPEAGADGGAATNLVASATNPVTSVTNPATSAPAKEFKAKARAAYQNFLTLWKDADPDVPVLKQAKAEYARFE